MSKVWLITGAGRGMGVDIAKAALAAGHKVVATGRNTDKVAQALGKSADLFVVKLDITKPKTRNPQSRHRWTSLAGSMCWSTMPQTFMRAFSKSCCRSR